MARRTPKKYPVWLKAWRKSGSPAWPEHCSVMLVHWTDAAYSEDHPGTVDTWTVGYLKSADEKAVTLAMEAFDDGDTRTHITVPAGMVNEIAVLGSISLKPDV